MNSYSVEITRTYRHEMKVNATCKDEVFDIVAMLLEQTDLLALSNPHEIDTDFIEQEIAVSCDDYDFEEDADELFCDDPTEENVFDIIDAARAKMLAAQKENVTPRLYLAED